MLLGLLDRVLFGKLSATAMTLAVMAYEQGDNRRGGRLMRIASAAAPQDAGLQTYGAEIAAKAGDYRIALRLRERALRIHPDHPDLIALVAITERELGDVVGATRRCEQAIERSADRDPGVALVKLLSELRRTGPSYLQVLTMIHEEFRPRTYLEIGVENGGSLAIAGLGTRAIGVDPMPAIRHPLPASTRIFSQTSDAFFAHNDLAELFGGLPVDLAFIDGMHLFEYVLRDFINVEKHCSAGSVVVLDDCWPLDRRWSSRERTSVFWTGDVWRVVPVLRKYRPDLRIRTVTTAPSGLCVVRGLDCRSRVLAENYAAIVEEFSSMDYAAFEANREAYLAPCPNDRDSVRQILG